MLILYIFAIAHTSSGLFCDLVGLVLSAVFAVCLPFYTAALFDAEGCGLNV